MPITKLSKAFFACALGASSLQPAVAQTLPYNLTDTDAKTELTIGQARNENSQLLPATAICREAALKPNDDLPAEISNYTLGRLSYGLDQDKPADRVRLAQLYSHYNIDADTRYGAWELPQRIAFLKSMQASPEILDAKKNWLLLSVEEKLTLARKVNSLQAQAYGFAAADFRVFNNGMEPGDVLTHAYYRNESNMIAVNIADTKRSDLNTAIRGSFAGFVALIAHEGDHAYAFRISEKYKNGTYQDDGAKKFPVTMASLMHNTRSGNSYMTASVAGFGSYELNPIEVNARRMQADVTYFFRSDAARQTAFIQMLEKRAENMAKYNAAIDRQISWEKSDTPCAAFG